MILQSVVSGQALCITDGELSAKGNRDEHCKKHHKSYHASIPLLQHVIIILYVHPHKT